MKFDLEATADASPERVFDVMTDLDSGPEWMHGDVRIEKLTEGEFGVGTEWRETRKMFGKEATEHFEVIGYDRPNSVELFVDGSKGASKKGRYDFVYRLHPEGDKTRIVLSCEISGMGFFGKIFGKLFSGMFKKAMCKDLEAMVAYAKTESLAEQE